MRPSPSRTLVDGVDAGRVDGVIDSALRSVRADAAVATVRVGGVPLGVRRGGVALEEVELPALAGAVAGDDRQGGQRRRGAEGVRRAAREAELAADGVRLIEEGGPSLVDCSICMVVVWWY